MIPWPPDGRYDSGSPARCIGNAKARGPLAAAAPVFSKSQNNARKGQIEKSMLPSPVGRLGCALPAGAGAIDLQ